MQEKKQVLAIDFGASSGRVMLGRYDGDTISIEEIHRFSNDPVIVTGTMYWDVLRLFHEIKQGLIKAKPYGKIDSIGIDTWGVDFGLLDKEGRLLENPVHYRDRRTEGLPEYCYKKMSPEKLYEITGIQIMDINSLFQVISLVRDRKELLGRAEALLFMPDLFNYFLTGKMVSEYSIATTSQMLDVQERNWSKALIEAFDIPKRLLKPIVPTGTKIGTILPEIARELGIPEITVMAVAGHDTQSALAAVPTKEEDFIFISCGTWSLFGTELSEPIINGGSQALNITNEGGYGGRISFLKNIIGLWLIQESRRQWRREGSEYGFGELETMAKGAEAFTCFINPDAPEFVPAGDIPERIREYAAKTGQKKPETIGQIVRLINESLAMTYKKPWMKSKHVPERSIRSSTWQAEEPRAVCFAR